MEKKRVSIMALVAFTFFFLLISSTMAIPSSIGINYGRVGNNLPSPYRSIGLLTSMEATRMKLYDVNPEILKLLAGTKIQVSIMVPNDQIPTIASSQSNADQWVRDNVLAYYPDTMIRFIFVGNEILSYNTDADREVWPFLVPAMRRIKTSIAHHNIKNIKITTALAMDMIESMSPPSSASFRSDMTEQVIIPLLRFINGTKSCFFVNVYPYFLWSQNPTETSLDSALLMNPLHTYTTTNSSSTRTNHTRNTTTKPSSTRTNNTRNGTYTTKKPSSTRTNNIRNGTYTTKKPSSTRTNNIRNGTYTTTKPSSTITNNTYTYIDRTTSLIYTNLLDQMLDSVVFAMTKLGFGNVLLGISETGWPNSGDFDEPGANVHNAATYNRNLVKKITADPPVGTPARPGVEIPTFLFSLFDENQKEGHGTERHWGLLYADGRPVYDLDLTGKRLDSAYPKLPEPTNNVAYKGNVWCVAANGVNEVDLGSALTFACGSRNGICDALSPGRECYEPISVNAHASYAFSAYWAQFRASGATCYFNGMAVQTNVDPSIGSCKYPSVTL